MERNCSGSTEWNLTKSIFFFFGDKMDKMVHVAIDRYFSFFLKGLEDFSFPKAITDSPFNKLLVHGIFYEIYVTCISKEGSCQQAVGGQND